ncbi:hypothetical protein ACFT5B_05605 [Luteimicrobium sp. NPDC057192]|uniref:hypothetical protein n=1 Tax=Luteimicrobium sp. NPDC057192 TaxID=3346042 RepID=UPI00364523FB
MKGVKEYARPPGPKHDSPNQLAAPARAPDPAGVTLGEHNVALGVAGVAVDG